MKIKRLFCGLTLSLMLTHLLFSATDAETAARREALDLAGAFSNDGYKIRDGNWMGIINPKESLLLQVNLFAGNQYWFSLGATEEAKKLDVTIFDETGKLIKSEPFQEGSRAAAGFTPEASGSYFIRIQELEGESAHFCLIYSYK